ncbi:MAG: apolipoprotein N-acyltransferase, partial [Pseudomonadales bacterium]
TLGLRDVSLVVWPEAAFTDFQQNRERLIRAMDEEMIRREAGLILGIPGRDDEGYTNTALGLGKAQGQYIKRHLVPFGEYVPLESWLRGVITFFDLPMSRNQPGPREQAPLTLNGITLALSICYEIAYPELVRSAARDPGLLVTISNDTWFGDSIGPWQHLQIAQMRALEMGRDLLRVTNNGVTALIDATGKQIAMLPRNEPGVLVGEVSLYEGKTPFQTWGYRFLWTVLMVAFFANVLWVWLAKQKGRSGFPHAQESDEVELPPSKKGP